MTTKPTGATWVTREHVFVDRVACPWLIRRFIDPAARFEFVPWDGAASAAAAAASSSRTSAADADVAAIERAGKIPFDMASGRFTHRKKPDGSELCTFEVLIEEFGLGADSALARVARVVHAADVERDLDSVPEGRGFKALSLGWRFLYTDDDESVREGAKLYDALYLWAEAREVQERDAAALARMSSLERYEHLRAALVR